MREKRSHLRVPETRAIAIRELTHHGFTNQHGAYLLDLSAGGIRFAGISSFPRGTLLEVDISLRECFLLEKALVEVVWAGRRDGIWEIGAHFLNLTYEQERAIRSFCYRQQLLRKRLAGRKVKGSAHVYKGSLMASLQRPHPQEGRGS